MRILKLAFACWAAISVGGCAFWGTAANDIENWNTTVRVLEKNKTKYSKTFEKDAAYCYEKTLEWLGHTGARVYEDREHSYIVAAGFTNIYKNCIDTTELGIFFKEPQPGKTEIEVSCLNHHLSQYVSERLFAYIEKPQWADEK